MNKLFSKVLIVAVMAFLLMMTNILASQAQQKDAVIVVYASWSVVSRDLRPVASSVAQAYKFPYEEYDVDALDTGTTLGNLNISIPTQTPYVVVIKDGNVVFKKAYPNSTPDLLKQDLTEILSNFI